MPVGEHWTQTLRSLGAGAVCGAIGDCGRLSPQALYIGSTFAPILSHQTNLGPLIAESCGLEGIETFTVEAAGASGAAAFRAAYMAVSSGFCDAALALGLEKVTDNTGSKATETQDLMLNYEYETTAGLTLTAGAALLSQRYLTEFGLDRGVLDCFSLSAYGQACGNPNALYHLRLNDEKLKGQTLSAPPLGMYDCAALADGAAALLLTREDRLPKSYNHIPVRILGSSCATAPLSLHDRLNLLDYEACAESAARVFHTSQVGWDQIDLWELWDAFSIDAILAKEAIGLTRRGEGWTADGRFSCCMGGNLGRGNPLGASSAYQLAEAALQLRGEAGGCQINGAQTAFVQAVGGLGATAISHILSAGSAI